MQLAHTVGIQRLIVVINKIDDPSVGYSKERYDFIVQKLTPFLRQNGYKEPIFMPISGITGENIKEKPTKNIAWYTGPTLLEALDSIPLQHGRANLPLRIPIIDKYRDARGMTVVMGKIETGTLSVGKAIAMAPPNVLFLSFFSFSFSFSFFFSLSFPLFYFVLFHFLFEIISLFIRLC